MKITLITFSPTGGTLRCAEALSIGQTVQHIDLTERCNKFEINPESEAVLIAVPSYGGRVPALAAERLKGLQGGGRKAVLLVVYGNRAFEDTLVELSDIVEAQGFSVQAAATAVAQHCMVPSIAAARPDEGDLARLRQFGQQIADRLGTENHPTIPGSRPYKKASSGMSPTTGKACNRCGLCARQCPAGAIAEADPTRVDTSLCIGCMRCVANCTLKAKQLPVAKRTPVKSLLSLVASGRKEPELFL